MNCNSCGAQQPETEELVKRLEAQINSANDKIRDLKDGLINDKLALISAGPEGDKFLARLRTDLAPMFAGMLLGAVDEIDAPNYLEIEAIAVDGRRVAITVQRMEKKTPHQLKVEAEDRAKRAEAVLKTIIESEAGLDMHQDALLYRNLARDYFKPHYLKPPSSSSDESA